MKSKLLFLLFTLHLISNIDSLSKVEISFSKENNKFYLTVYLGSKKIPMPLVIDTSIPMSLINSPNCQVCIKSKTYTYDPRESDDSKLIGDAIYKKGIYEYMGYVYNDSISIPTYDSTIKEITGKINLLSIEEISLITQVTENGLLSLSYYSEILMQEAEKRIFVLDCSDSSGTITLGGINTEIINTTSLVYFPIKTDDNLKKWYLEPNKLILFNETLDISFKEPQKIVIDSTTWQLHIPKSFFLSNSKLLLSSKCQIQPSGLFYCVCSEKNSYAFFPTYKFQFEKGHLLVEPKDYIAYAPSSGYCILYININYANDDWILGINVLNNYYTVFDYEDKKIAFYDRKNVKVDSSWFLIILISVGVSSVIILFGGFWIYKRFISNYFNRSSVPEPVPVNEVNQDSEENEMVQ